MDCKYGCTCKHCLEAEETRKKLSKRRKLPAFVIEQIKAKTMAREEDMLRLGYINLPCNKCNHYVWVKIGPIMTCPACCGSMA